MFWRFIPVLACAIAFAAERGETTTKPGGGFNLFTEEQESEIGRGYSEQLARQLNFVSDASIQAYVERLGGTLARRSLRPDIEFRFYIVNTEEVNAYALPGGYIYINRGLVEVTDNESELAAAIGHEMGHVIGRHATREMSRQMLLGGVLGAAGSAVGPVWSDSARTGGRTGAMLVGLRFSRDDERQSDSMGLAQMYKAGFDPNAMATLFEKLDQMSGGKRKGLAGLSFLNAHPMAADRAKAMREEIAQLPHPQPAESSIEYEKAKLALMVHPWPPKPAGAGEVKTLRRKNEGK